MTHCEVTEFPARLTTLHTDYGSVELYVDTVSSQSVEEFNFKKEHSIMTDCYEVIVTNGQMYADLTANIKRNTSDSLQEQETKIGPPERGWIFHVETDEPHESADIRFACYLVEYSDDGEITVPDEPFDSGQTTISEGYYRLYEKTF